MSAAPPSPAARPADQSQISIIVTPQTNKRSVLCCSHLGLVLAGHVCPADPRAAPRDDLVKDGLHQLGVAALDQLTQPTIIISSLYFRTLLCYYLARPPQTLLLRRAPPRRPAAAAGGRGDGVDGPGPGLAAARGRALAPQLRSAVVSVWGI